MDQCRGQRGRAGSSPRRAGSGYTWAGNSQANRLTPWNNDPVSDPPGEVLYLRDEETGALWSPTPLPITASSAVAVRHGQGYTTYERLGHGLAQELTVFVPAEDPVKVLLLKLSNVSGRVRHLSVTFYAEWVLGVAREAGPDAASSLMIDPETAAPKARNAFNADFGNLHFAFADVDRRPRTLTADRVEFLGRNGSVNVPPWPWGRVELSNAAPPPDSTPCAALQVSVVLQPGEETELAFLLGQAPDLDAARALALSHRDPGHATWRGFLCEVREGYWDRTLSAVQVHTPDPALDPMRNRWLNYQVLSCRLWWPIFASGQSGGRLWLPRPAPGRQWHLVYGRPDEARRHILRSAARQFF